MRLFFRLCLLDIAGQASVSFQRLSGGIEGTTSPAPYCCFSVQNLRLSPAKSVRQNDRAT
ncbi:hypothetical protein BBB56_20605 [Candidatus Pantoea deserta]|uniref:Uncharacterized protein n=1 Tax=Candidatus Pantoea deserta TaxID=1869313 RepID=A0A3N4NR06_9GAMM|nr:hypothetical protein BBB56_20605 [Pantoea deserta]